MRIEYTVFRIDGDYAILKNEQNDETLVALALLPFGIMEGDKLIWENFEYFKA